MLVGEGIVHVLPVAAHADQPRLLQYPQLMADRALVHLDHLRDPRHVQLGIEKGVQYLYARAVGEYLEQVGDVAERVLVPAKAARLVGDLISGICRLADIAHIGLLSLTYEYLLICTLYHSFSPLSIVSCHKSVYRQAGSVVLISQSANLDLTCYQNVHNPACKKRQILTECKNRVCSSKPLVKKYGVWYN